MTMTNPRHSYAVVTAPVEFDLATSPDFREDVADRLADLPWLIVDLSPVAFIDSTGIGALLAARRRAQNLGGDLVLVGASSRVRRVLRLTQVERVLTCYDRIDDVPSPGPVP